jgi:hypothetical protein
MKFTEGEIALLIKLRKEKYIEQRLGNIFRKTFPDRNDASIRNKIFSLRCQKRIPR